MMVTVAPRSVVRRLPVTVPHSRLSTVRMAARTASVLVPIANGSEEMEAVIVIDVLRRAKIDVCVASVEKTTTVVASRGVKLEADKGINDCSGPYDMIVLPVLHPQSLCSLHEMCRAKIVARADLSVCRSYHTCHPNLKRSQEDGCDSRCLSTCQL
jgi:hypothetical protein